MKSSLLLLAPLTFCLILACGDGGETTSGGGASGAGGMDDGRVRPEPNGVHITEAEACDALQTAYKEKAMACAGQNVTVRTCPNFVKALYDPDCVEFDQGSVQGCVEHYQSVQCELRTEDGGVATVYPGSEPAGCP